MKYQPISRAITAWHNGRMWNYVENGFESISMESLQKLGIVGSIDEEIKARAYIVKEGYVYPKRQEKEKHAIESTTELRTIAETMRSLESL